MGVFERNLYLENDKKRNLEFWAGIIATATSKFFVLCTF